MERQGGYGQLIIHPDFYKVLEDLKKVNVNINVQEDIEPSSYEDSEIFPEGNVYLSETSEAKDLNPVAGYENINKNSHALCAYDESLIKIPALEGTGYFFSHALVILSKDAYVPIVDLTFYFFTRSKNLADGKNKIIYSKDVTVDSKRVYIKDKSFLLENYTPNNSILLLDGPLIGGQLSNESIELNGHLLNKNIIPVFLVKNSGSTLVVDNFKELKDNYNSDFEWALKTLKNGQRTPLILYEDKHNKNNNKYFTYIKAFDFNIIRVEFHSETWKRYKNDINAIFDIIFYELLSHGDKNPQPKIVAIAENYAREILNIINVKNILREIGVTPTMNYTRFGWG